jgi:hypothetical protein
MKLLFFLFFGFFPLATNANENNNYVLEVSSTEVAPFSYMKNGKISGININIIEQIEKIAHLNFHYTLYPHGRFLKNLENSHPDLMIVFKVSCEKYNTYEVRKKFFSGKPSIHLKKSIDPKKQDIRVARIIGTCIQLTNQNIKSDHLIDVVNMDQAFKMLNAGRLDGVCGNDPVIQYNMNRYKELKNNMKLYLTQPETDNYDAVLCLKKSLPPAIKKKINDAAEKVVLPNFANFF